MAPYEAMYGRRCRSPVGWFELGEARLLGTDLVRDALEKVKLIQYRLRTAQSKQKTYADHRVRDIAFMVGERFLLQYHSDPSHILDISLVQLDNGLTYVEEPVAIFDRQVRKLRSKNIASVKILQEAENVKAIMHFSVLLPFIPKLVHNSPVWHICVRLPRLFASSLFELDYAVVAPIENEHRGC
ncbi:uncharacterized protein [Nicotiana tomentosiformis]|uniref:uncharacterized protein n=1 Tax=Nicotiana tomentosiformis TaxID=4098 RepID=UPI00388C7F3F